VRAVHAQLPGISSRSNVTFVADMIGLSDSRSITYGKSVLLGTALALPVPGAACAAAFITQQVHTPMMPAFITSFARTSCRHHQI
jgi:hypothetical protein